MNARPTPTLLDTLATALPDALTRWETADARVRDLHRALAERPGGDPATWRALLRAQRRREREAAALGHVLGRWTAIGGTLELLDPEEEPAAPDLRTGVSPGAEPLDEALPPEPGEEAAATPQEAGASAPASLDAAVATDDTLTVVEPRDDTPGAAALHPPAAAPVTPTPADAPIEPVAPGAPVQPEPTDRTKTPSPTPSTIAEPPAPRATQADLERLLSRGLGADAPDPEVARQSQASQALHALVDRLAGPLTPQTVGALDDLPRQLPHLRELGPTILVDLMTLAVARLRGLQARGHTADRLFRALTRVNREEQFGYVHGLARDHRAKGTSWDADADAIARHYGAQAAEPAAPVPCSTRLAELDLGALSPKALRAAVLALLDDGVDARDGALVRALKHRADDLKGDGRLKPLRRAIADLTGRKAATKKRPKGSPGPNWPFWHLTRGRSLVIVGGDPRAHNRDQLKAAFDFAEVEWPEHDKNTLKRIAQRASHGTVDLLLFNRYGGHDMDDTALAAVREDLRRWVRVDGGYGVKAVKQAMEQQWRAFAPGT